MLVLNSANGEEVNILPAIVICGMRRHLDLLLQSTTCFVVQQDSSETTTRSRVFCFARDRVERKVLNLGADESLLVKRKETGRRPSDVSKLGVGHCDQYVST